MAQERKVRIPITCENLQCRNFNCFVNVVSGTVSREDIELFYEGYDGSEKADYCPACGELGVAEEFELL